MASQATLRRSGGRARLAWRQPALIGLVGLAAVSTARVAKADPPGPEALPVTVVAIKSDDALDQAEALTVVLKKAVRDAKGWSLQEGNHSLEFLSLQMKCTEPIDAACEARIADVIKSDRYLWGVIGLKKGEVVGTLNMFERGKGTHKAPLKYSGNLTEPTDDSLIRVAAQALSIVTGGPPKGGLRVTSGGIAAQIYVDDAPLGALDKDGGTFQLPSGSHRIVVKAVGYADAETTVSVRPATTVDAQLTLVPKEEEKPVDGRIIGGLASLAVGVGAGAVGLWAALKVNTLKDDETLTQYRQSLTKGQNACDEAAAGRVPAGSGFNSGQVASVSDTCNQASTMEILQAVFFPTAAVAVGVGGFLLGTSSLAGGDEEPTPAGTPKKAATRNSWSLTPTVSPTLQHLQFTYRF